MAERRAEALAGRSCGYCGGTDRLEFHHFDQHAKVDHKVWSWTPARRERELAKCVVLCHDCHVSHHRANRRAFCKRGHEFTPANTYVKPSRGTRECLTCKRQRRDRRAARAA